MPTLAPQLLSIPEVAKRLGISRAQVYRFIARGALPTVQLGDERSYKRIPEPALAAFIEARTTNQPTT